MKQLSPYWFLKDPIDSEHKYYILMDFLQSVEKDLDERKYSEPIQKLTRVYNDLKSFSKSNKFTDKTVKNLSQKDLEIIKEISNMEVHESTIKEILDSSLEIVETFITKVTPYLEEIEKSLSFKILNETIPTRDRGYVTIRNNKDKKLKIYSWAFSIVKIEDSEQVVGLLLSELLDPLPDYTKSDKKIYDFFNKEIKNFSKKSDCFILVDIEKTKGEDEISFDLIKERSIDFIVNNYKKYLSIL